MEINDKSVRVYDVRAIRLVKQRAVKENRSFANAAAVTIIERLGGGNNTISQSICQEEFRGASHGEQPEQG